MESPVTCLKYQGEDKDADSFTSVLAYTKGCFFLKECEAAAGRERFDEFIQKYMKTFQFRSLTTEEFLDFLKSELPEVFEWVDVQTWVYKPGMPETWHRPQSHLFEEVKIALADLHQGNVPTREQVKDWHRYQILSFLQELPSTMSVEDCKTLEDALELEKRNDDHFFSYFFSACILSGYREILPRVENFVERIGRMLYLMPVARAMVEADWTRDKVRPLFERVRDRHHPVTVNVMEGFLKRAGV